MILDRVNAGFSVPNAVNVIIEIPLDDVRGDLKDFDSRVIDAQGLVEIATDDVSASLSQLSAQVHGLNRVKIRQPNLEDLFLELTKGDVH